MTADQLEGWVKKKKGSAYIYTKDGYPNAIVDRRGMGVMKSGVTYNGDSYNSVAEAALAAYREASK